MMENKQCIDSFQLPVKRYELFQVFNIPVLIEKTIPELKISDKVISQQYNPLVEKNFVHLPYEKV